MAVAAYPRLLLLLSAAACVGAEDGGPSCDLSGPHLVVATSDFRVGALAAVTADGCVDDQLSSTSGDAVVRATDERVWVINRTGGDALLGYRHGAYSTPELELGAYRHDNPQDLVRVGDRLFLSLFERSEVVVLDAADGRELGVVDLSAYADDDGLPEVAGLVVMDGSVFVGMQRMNRHVVPWAPSGPGALARIDAASMEVVDEWATDTNTRLGMFDQGIAVMSGTYFSADGQLEILRPEREGGATREALLTESDVGLDLGEAAAGVVSGTAFEAGGASVIGCVGDGGFVEGMSSKAWYVGMVDARGLGMGVVVGARTGFAGDGRPGLWSVDSEGCEAVELGVDTLLEPFSLAVVE